MKRLQLVPPGTIARLRQSAEQAWNERDLPQCIDLLERAARLSPADAGVWMQLARMHGMRYDYDAAERCFERALRVIPQKAEGLTAAARQARDFYSTRLAEDFAERAAQERGIRPDLLVNLAEIFERLRKADIARTLAHRALTLDTHCAGAQLVLARLAHRAGQLDEAERVLRDAIPTLIGPSQAGGWYELGAVLDRQERYTEAMDAFLRAKSLLRQDANPQITQLRRVRSHLAQMREQLTPDLIEGWAKSSALLQPARRLALLCGHPRSGTTLLEQVLDAHPDMISAEETNNFTDYSYVPLQRRHPPGTPILRILDTAQPEHLRSARDAYFRASELCIGEPLNNRLLIDKNPSLTFMAPALVRVFPEIKFLVALRDPRDVCLSCFMQPFIPVQQVSAAYLTLEDTVDEYASLMGTWRTVAPMLTNPVLEVRYEDMIDDLEAVARRVLSFLDLPWDSIVLGFDAHARQKVVRSPTYADVTQKVFTRARGRWHHYAEFLQPHFPKLDPFLRALGYE